MKIKALFEERNFWFVTAGSLIVVTAVMCTMIMLFIASSVAQTQGW